MEMLHPICFLSILQYIHQCFLISEDNVRIAFPLKASVRLLLFDLHISFHSLKRQTNLSCLVFGPRGNTRVKELRV
jgi:hypothetical protein